MVFDNIQSTLLTFDNENNDNDYHIDDDDDNDNDDNDEKPIDWIIDWKWNVNACACVWTSV